MFADYRFAVALAGITSATLQAQNQRNGSTFGCSG